MYDLIDIIEACVLTVFINIYCFSAMSCLIYCAVGIIIIHFLNEWIYGISIDHTVVSDGQERIITVYPIVLFY